jgi:arginine utilization regulatory protein
MLLDMTDTKQTLHAILSTIDEGIHAVDAKGMTIFYNYIAAKHDGLSIDEVLGKHVLSVFPSLSKDTSTLLKVIQTGEPIKNQHQSYHNLRGHLIDTVNTTLPIRVNGECIGAVEIAKDLTKVKQLSEKLLDLQAKVENNRSRKTLAKNTCAAFQMTDIITKHPGFLEIKANAVKAAKTTSPILVYGQTGTGKELLVQSIHNTSSRRSQSFIAQNCAAIPSALLESILFGTAKGSYTGAVERPGLFELADGGTLFLDEINSMPLDIQAKMLRILQNGLIRRVGGSNEYSVDVRIITAMNEHPQNCIRDNTLRKDLYYRLNVVYFHIPPLQDRKEDILLLTDYFIQKFNYKFERLVTKVDPQIYHCFLKYNWPGNVRELEHAIESAMNLMEGDTILVEHLPQLITQYRESINSSNLKTAAAPEENIPIIPLRHALKETEEKLISHAMKEASGNVQLAAQLLKIPRQTLQYKLSKIIGES